MSNQADKINFTEALIERWWQRMSEIFGRIWVEQFGSKPTESWREELRTWSIDLAAAVLVHYQRAGLKFPPNLSEVGKLARELKPTIERLPIPRRTYEPNAVAHRFAVQFKKDQAWIEKYCHDNPGATVHEGAMALMTKRGHAHCLPESLISEAREVETAELKREATATVAHAKELE